MHHRRKLNPIDTEDRRNAEDRLSFEHENVRSRPSTQSGESFAIADLLQELIRAAKLSDSDFVRVLGYNNINKGLRRLESWRQLGTGDADFLKRVAEQFAVSRHDLERSLIRTIEQLSCR